ncbi:MAG: 7-carboxy-7-deazaguanine synthase QueE [Cytophagales bacterium]|nr:7-carboxy-7-deazaguanine synthase QueE [Cytophagales bacterium]MDW8384819.1 7-carboxy-7-deazaguanine synthase QueE [Flammeovirgaceae bacterium]
MEYPVMEAFYTLQGEGVWSGHAAYFIRLAGCDVGCVWCDVKESWNASRHPIKTVEQIVFQALQYPARIAVITGGEPVMYNLNPLIYELQRVGFRCHLETSGAYPLQGCPDWICLSPKKFKAPLAEYFEIAHELKIVVFHKSDLTWATELASHVKPTCALLLQPEWDKRNIVTPLIIEFIKQNPQWKISLQTHKYLHIP